QAWESSRIMHNRVEGVLAGLPRHHTIDAHVALRLVVIVYHHKIGSRPTWRMPDQCTGWRVVRSINLNSQAYVCRMYGREIPLIALPVTKKLHRIGWGEGEGCRRCCGDVGVCGPETKVGI